MLTEPTPQAIATPPEVPGYDRHLADGAVHGAVTRARDALLAQQRPEGDWCFPLEADCTIPSEYILMMHYMDEIDPALQTRFAHYLRSRQGDDGGWPQYQGGEANLSTTVKTYWALKLAGDSPDDLHMARARARVHALGGAERANVFTRIELHNFGQLPRRGIPYMPVEAAVLPSWFPVFGLDRISYWSRTVMVPLLILYTLGAKAKNPTGIGVRELFCEDPNDITDYFSTRSPLNRVFLALERTASRCDRFVPGFVRRAAMRHTCNWMLARLNGLGGLGAIFPAMVKAYEVLDALGYDTEHPQRMTALQAIQDLIVLEGDGAYPQPCNSAVWDTALTALALQEVGDDTSRDAARRGLDWLLPQQLTDAPGDWRRDRPNLAGGGWPFQYRNDHYPDLEDTAAVAWAMDQDGSPAYHDAIARAANWIRGMQSKNGGFASFDADNTASHLNEIPFADHGALLDPPTADVSARCISLLGRLAPTDEHYRVALYRCIDFLRAEQEEDGSWFGRWGTNYVYGTWSVLASLREVGVPAHDLMIRRAAAWLAQVQRADGGWGESNDSYADPATAGQGPESNSFQTAWALLGLMAAGQADSDAARRGVAYLTRTQQADGLWSDAAFTAPGFPRVFYLKYHGYTRYFPLWALARYRALTSSA